VKLDAFKPKGQTTLRNIFAVKNKNERERVSLKKCIFVVVVLC